MTLAEFAAMVDAKPAGDVLVARCPAHEDRNPSLSIAEGRDGRVLLTCHAGCTVEQILAALGLTVRDLFADNRTPSREIVATYPYDDETGTLLFEVVRFAPKRFRQRRPDGKGGWIWNLNGTRRVLYRLPRLAAAIAVGKRVWVVEGEKDVAALETLGHVATTNPGGAGKWRPEYTETLRGADVVIVADKDEPGRAHARRVAEALHCVAAKVVLVEAAVGKDVTDHLSAGRKLGELLTVALGAARTSPSDATALTHIRDLLAEPDDAVSWIVDRLLPAGGLSVLAGKPKGGKSTLARAIALRVSRGEPILGRATTKGPVIYLGLEDSRRVTKQHFRTLEARDTDDLYVYTGTRPAEAIAWLEKLLATVDPVLVVVDTMQHLLGVSDLNDYAHVVAALGPLLRLVRGRRAHLMLLHHAGKGARTGFDAVLGSVGIVGTTDTNLLLRRRDDGTRTLASLQRTGEELPECVLTLDANQEPRLEGTRADYDARQTAQRVLDWLREQGEPVTRKVVEESVEGRAESVRATLYRLVGEGKVARSGAGNRWEPYLFHIACPVSPSIPGHADTQAEIGSSSPDDAALACPADSRISVPRSDSGTRCPHLPDGAMRAALDALDPTGWDAANPEGATMLDCLQAVEEAAIERAAIQAEGAA